MIVVFFKRLKSRSAIGMLLVASEIACGARGQGSQTFSGQVLSVLRRPEYKHASFGLEIYSLDREKALFTLNAEKLFTPGSTTKLLTEGSALELLGKDFRFHTPIYRTGEIKTGGVMAGDLVLVASGDPNLSNRIQPNGTLAFENEDHSYGGLPATKAVPGDPLKVLREFAEQISAKGIKKINGRVIVDASLFSEGEPELGTGVVISPISVNDNVLDLTISPGASVGALAGITVSPQVASVKIVNKVVTSAPGAGFHVEGPTESANTDGTFTVTLSGNTAAGGKSILVSYPVNQPTRFAEEELIACLAQRGITVSRPASAEKIDIGQYKRFYKPENLVAEHTSPPFSEDVRVTLKVSQNLHASMTPYLIGAILAKATTNIEQAGFDKERAFLEAARLDLTGASQSDGAGGSGAAFFTPDFMVHFLSYMAKQKDGALFQSALPVLGRDGSLAEIQIESRAAGHVFAKTGTYGSEDMLNRRLMLNGKGLAGYLTTKTGQHLAFAFYVNHVSLPLDDPLAAQETAGQALGEIAAAAYLLPVDQQTLTAGLR